MYKCLIVWVWPLTYIIDHVIESEATCVWASGHIFAS